MGIFKNFSQEVRSISNSGVAMSKSAQLGLHFHFNWKLFLVRTRDPNIYWPIPKSGALILGRNQQIGALFNTIYLHGDWKYKFNERATRKSNFQVDTIGTKILVDMMYLKGVLRGGFDRELEINWIELPYNVMYRVCAVRVRIFWAFWDATSISVTRSFPSPDLAKNFWAHSCKKNYLRRAHSTQSL